MRRCAGAGPPRLAGGGAGPRRARSRWRLVATDRPAAPDPGRRRQPRGPPFAGRIPVRPPPARRAATGRRRTLDVAQRGLSNRLEPRRREAVAWSTRAPELAQRLRALVPGARSARGAGPSTAARRTVVCRGSRGLGRRLVPRHARQRALDTLERRQPGGPDLAARRCLDGRGPAWAN